MNRFQTYFASFFAVCTVFFLTGCSIGGDLNEVYINAKHFSIPAILVLVLNLYFMYHIIKSRRSVLNKIIWCIVIWIMPVVGSLLYWFFSHDPAPKKA